MGEISAVLQQTRFRPELVEPPPDGEEAGAVVQSWTGEKVRDLIRAPDLMRRYDRWMTLVKYKMPRLNEVLGSDQATELNDAMLLYRVPGDFAFVHHGAAAVKLIGTNLTGTLLSARSNAIARGVAKVYTKSIAVAEPFYIRHIASVASNAHFFSEQIVLPIAADERREVEFVLIFSAPLDDKTEVLTAIFERSQIGMIAATSSHDENGKLQNGRILMINSVARKIMKLPDAVGSLQTVRDLGPWFRDGALWTKTEVVTQDKLTHIHFHERGSGKKYRVTIEPVQNFVLFSIMDASGLR